MLLIPKLVDGIFFYLGAQSAQHCPLFELRTFLLVSGLVCHRLWQIMLAHLFESLVVKLLRFCKVSEIEKVHIFYLIFCQLVLPHILNQVIDAKLFVRRSHLSLGIFLNQSIFYIVKLAIEEVFK